MGTHSFHIRVFPLLQQTHFPVGMLRSLGLSQTQSYEDIKGPPSTPPGYPVTTSQCSAITKCYCIRPKDILGSSQTGSNKPSAGIRPTLPKSGLQSCRTGGHDALSILSSITHLLPPSPKTVRSTRWLPMPLLHSQMPPPLFFLCLCKVFRSTF